MYLPLFPRLRKLLLDYDVIYLIGDIIIDITIF